MNSTQPSAKSDNSPSTLTRGQRVFVILFFGMIVGAMICGFIWSVRDARARRPISFESAVWKSTPYGANRATTRIRMVEDFIKTHDLTGKSRAEVVALLGEPEKTDILGCEMAYLLDREVETAWLTVDLEDDQVIECRVATSKD
ncbi:MAG TPA: hypothetical protein PK402_02145 [Tepidisphaeraceae bacterium]|nr:hypothetical protein [Tepidisphaeraceae bacterium]